MNISHIGTTWILVKLSSAYCRGISTVLRPAALRRR